MSLDLTKLTDHDRILLAGFATLAAGPGATEQQIGQALQAQIDLHRAGGVVDSVLHQAERRAERIADVKHFTGTIVHVDREIRAQRAVVVLHTGTERSNLKDGQEVVRTARLDDAREAQRARDLGNLAASLVGHRVRVTIEMEKGRGDMKFRVLAALDDLGADPEYNPQDPRFRLSPKHAERPNEIDFSKWQVASTMFAQQQ